MEWQRHGRVISTNLTKVHSMVCSGPPRGRLFFPAQIVQFELRSSIKDSEFLQILLFKLLFYYDRCLMGLDKIDTRSLHEFYPRTCCHPRRCLTSTLFKLMANLTFSVLVLIV